MINTSMKLCRGKVDLHNFQNKRLCRKDRAGNGEQTLLFFFFFYQVDRKRQTEQKQPDVEMEGVGENI